MNSIALVAALDDELRNVRDHITKGWSYTVHREKFLNTTITTVLCMDITVYIACTGVGKVSAADFTQKLIDDYAPDIILNIGVAGDISGLDIGDIVVANSLAQHDFDCSLAGYYDLGQIPGYDEVFFHIDNSDLNIVKTALELYCEGMQPHFGIVASGDQFITDHHTKTLINSRFGAMCVDMESSAIAQVCYINQQRFIVIKSISDHADEHANKSFNSFIDFAVTNLLKLALGIIYYLNDN